MLIVPIDFVPVGSSNAACDGRLPTLTGRLDQDGGNVTRFESRLVRCTSRAYKSKVRFVDRTT
jgi:hypothetical protein